MKNDIKTKKGRILKHLQSGRALTHLQAIRLYSHSRLASCVCRLRKEGYPIETTIRYTIMREPFGEYRMKQ